MLVEKTFITGVNIGDPVNYCADATQFLMNALRRQYGGRCYKGVYITRILEITKRSECVIVDTNLSADGVVTVEFRALVLVLGQGDIITGVRIQEGEEAKNILGVSDDEGKIVAIFQPSQGATVIRKNQVVAMRVLHAQAPPFRERLAVIGTLLVCDTRAAAYNVTTTLSEQDAAELGFLIDHIKRELDRRKHLVDTRKDDVFFFEELLYSYSGRRTGTATAPVPGAAAWVGPGGVKGGTGEDMNIFDVLAADTRGVWTRGLHLYRSSPFVTRLPSRGAEEAGAVAAPARTVFEAFLKNMLDFLTVVNRMVQEFDPIEKIESHKNIWMAMRRAQLPPPST